MRKMIRMSKTSVSKFESMHNRTCSQRDRACQKEELSEFWRKLICYWWHFAILIARSLNIYWRENGLKSGPRTLCTMIGPCEASLAALSTLVLPGMRTWLGIQTRMNFLSLSTICNSSISIMSGFSIAMFVSAYREDKESKNLWIYS